MKTANPAFFEFLLELFRRHPDYSAKTHNMVDVCIVQNQMSNAYELNVVRADGTTEDISWRICVDGKSKNNLLAAMRAAVDPQILEFGRTSEKQCSLCGTRNAEFHVDHIVHFEKLSTEFLADKTCLPTRFDDTFGNRACFREEDYAFQRSWADYHETHAQFRILCKSCNLKRKKWKNEVHISSSERNPKNVGNLGKSLAPTS